MVGIVQLVRTSDCGSEGRRFEPDYPPKKPIMFCYRFFLSIHNNSNNEYKN